MRLFICKHCGNIITFVKDSGVGVVCCGEPMQELIPGSVDASIEKHIPMIHRNKSLVMVEVGAVSHPMAENHFIEWIVLETKQGVQRKCLKPETLPQARFWISEDDEVVAAYAFCNLHGLWKS